MIHQWGGWVGGAITTLACCVLLSLGAFRSLNNAALDLHFRFFSRIPADSRIVLIDIDDGSLEAVGDWPWPRRRHAEIVHTLHELGADCIALDIVFSDPTPTPVTTEANRETFEEFANHNAISDDDRLLRDAIRVAGNVHLAMYGRLVDTRNVHATENNPDALHQTVQAQRNEARRKATAFLETHPHARLQEFLRVATRLEKANVISPARLILQRAFRWATARRETLAKKNAQPPVKDPPRFDVIDPVFPLASFAHVASDVGFVAYVRDPTDGVVREVPAIVGSPGQTYLQFAFGIASRFSPDLSNAGNADKTTAIDRISAPVDEDGLTLINWHVARGSRDWRSSFTHIPAARLLEIEDARRAITENKNRLAVAMAKLVETRFADTPGEYARYVQAVNAWLDAQKRLGDCPPEQKKKLASKAAELRGSLDAMEHDAELWLQHVWSLWKEVEPQGDSQAEQKEIVMHLYRQFGHGELETEIAKKNQRLAARIEKLQEELAPQIRGKICLVGYTASAQGDLVPTPVHSAMPGVMVHANIVNMLLMGKIPRRASLWVNWVLLMIAGGMVTLASGTRRWETGVAATVIVVGLVLFVGASLFATRAIHLATFPAIVTALATWAVVTSWRQSTVERVRRNLTRALTQYASPAVASRIAREMNVTDLAPESATVTCFFCDLAGFTTMSETLGPQRTRDILNPYLATASEELVARGALVNKFIGDGVFAFFNAPILRCNDHATRACESALAILREVGKLESVGGDKLAVRIGVATGVAFVGDYGSGVKLDYTCIGDTVNVGSRLERAGKMLGASILVDQKTRDDAGPGLVFRPMGRLRVQGRTEPVGAAELLDPACDFHAARIASIEKFAEALRRFQCCQWDSCIRILQELRSLDAQDGPVDVYLRVAQTRRDQDAAIDSPGVLEVNHF